MPSTALNLHGVSTLIADSDAFMASLLARMIRGFGMGGPEIVDTMAKAREHLQRKVPDLVIVEATLSDGAGFELVSWIRHQAATPLRFVPVIMMSSSPRAKSVTAARDAGANFVMRKPVSPAALLDRIAWIARSERPYIQTDSFIGPDRRFEARDPPDGALKRPEDENAEQPAQAPEHARSALVKGFAK